MNLVDSNSKNNPDSTKAPGSTKASEPTSPAQLCQQLDQMTESLKQHISNAAKAGASFDAVEREIHQAVFAIGRQAVDLFLHLQGDGDLGPEITTSQNVTLQRSQKEAKTTIRSVFGTHQFEQFTYAPGSKKGKRSAQLSALQLSASRPSCFGLCSACQ